MHAEAYEIHHEQYGEELDCEDVLGAVASLRDELSLVANDMRAVISENARLRQELQSLRSRRETEQFRGRRERTPRVSEVHHIRDEIDQLVHLHEAASGERARGYEERPVRRPHNCGCDDEAARMKKMFMMMMMADLV